MSKKILQEINFNRSHYKKPGDTLTERCIFFFGLAFCLLFRSTLLTTDNDNPKKVAVREIYILYYDQTSF